MENSYFTYIDNEFKCLKLNDIVKQLDLPPNTRLSSYSNERKKIWSARLATGLFGLTSCKSGNKSPKGINEVILSVGDQGLTKLIELGFITCPVCKPEHVEGFWDTIKDLVRSKYAINKLENFVDKELLSFDARRIRWEYILPVINATPSRIYLPKGLTKKTIIRFKQRFEVIGFKLPEIGYYDPNLPGRFKKYVI